MEEVKIIHKGDKFTYYLGQIVNDKTIISDKIIINNVSHVKVKCKCNKEYIVQIGQLTSRKACRSCAIEKRGLTYKDISSDFYSHIKNAAKSRDIYFNISPEDIYNQYIKQDKKCIYTGLNLIFTQRRNRSKLNNIINNRQLRGNASVDRIDSSKGYIKDNIQIVHKDINIMKNKHSDEYFISLCKLVANK